VNHLVVVYVQLGQLQLLPRWGWCWRATLIGSSLREWTFQFYKQKQNVKVRRCIIIIENITIMTHNQLNKTASSKQELFCEEHTTTTTQFKNLETTQ
jgi:hypothetical protein